MRNVSFCDIQCDLSEVFILPKTFLRDPCILQGEGPVKDGGELSSNNQIHYFCKVGECTHRRTDDAQMLCEDVAVIYFELGTTAIPYGKQPTTFSQRSQALHE